MFEELDGEGSFLDVTVKRIDILAKYRGMPVKFKELIEKQGVTIVMTTHDTGLMEIADCIYHIEDGEIADED